MSEIIDQVADAMWEKCRDLPEMPMFAHEHGWADQWPDEFAWLRSMIRSQARAAIQAMRDPTAAMIQTACNKHTPGEPMSPGGRTCVHQHNAVFRWQAMVDAALK